MHLWQATLPFRTVMSVYRCLRCGPVHQLNVSFRCGSQKPIQLSLYAVSQCASYMFLYAAAQYTGWRKLSAAARFPSWIVSLRCSLVQQLNHLCNLQPGTPVSLCLYAAVRYISRIVSVCFWLVRQFNCLYTLPSRTPFNYLCIMPVRRFNCLCSLLPVLWEEYSVLWIWYANWFVLILYSVSQYTNWIVSVRCCLVQKLNISERCSLEH
jgi:hypothetical protein